MKKGFKFLFSLVFVLVIGFTLVTCDPEGGDPACTHDWNWTLNAAAATCTLANKDTATCKNAGCNETNVRNGSIAALGHEGIGALAAACTTDGNTGTGTCTRAGCGFVGTNSVIPALGHDASGAAATCTVAKICARTSCDHDIQAALGHDASGTEATCFTSKICARTGCNYDIQTALGHDWDWTTYTNGIRQCQRNICTFTAGLGDTGPAGGKIIYVAPAGFTVTSTTSAFTTYTAYYLEAAPTIILSRWSTRFSAPFLNVTGTLLTIGSGRNNTALILELDSTAPAALACKNYFVTGFETYTDWFLPSRDELYQLYLRRADFSIILDGRPYWSSSQGTLSSNAWAQNFNDAGFQYDNFAKESNIHLIAVRAF